MKSAKTTKAALITSVLVVLVCVSMLVGTTFAWFTDTATVSANKIVAGNLDVGLEMKEGDAWVNAEGKTIDFLAADGNKDILWEPGCTYVLPELRIVNKGDLHLKYTIAITGIDGNAKLNEAIEWSYIGEAKASLAPGESKTFTIRGHMIEGAGNEYQGLSIDGISITVYASQKDAEYDSFGNTYDQNAPEPELYQDVNLTGDTNGKHLVGNGTSVMTNTYLVVDNTVENYIIDAGVGNAAQASIIIGDNTFNNCVFVAEGTNRSFWADDVKEGATITFNNCTFKSAVKLGGNESNKYVFNNCSFEGKVDWTKGLITAYTPIELNNCTFDRTAGALYDVYKSIGLSDDVITVTGGEVIVAGKATASDPIVTVLKTEAGAEPILVAANTEALAAAYTSTEVSKIYLGSASYALPGADISAAGKTLIGNGATQIENIYNLNNVTVQNCEITFAAPNSAYASRIYGDVKFAGCTFTGEASFWSDPQTDDITMTFEDCVFEKKVQLGYRAGIQYNFTRCSFDGSNWTGTNVITYAACEFADCTFTKEYGVKVALDYITMDDVVFSGTTNTLKK